MALVTNSVQFVSSNYTTDFRRAIPARVDNNIASDYADIQIAEGSQLVGANKLIIKSIRLLDMVSTHDWRVEFWDKTIAIATGTNLNNWGLLGVVDLYRTPAVAQTGAIYATSYVTGTLYTMIAENLDIPYEDREGKGQLHVGLLNLSGTAKSAGDVGAVHLRVGTIAAS